MECFTYYVTKYKVRSQICESDYPLLYNYLHIIHGYNTTCSYNKTIISTQDNMPLPNELLGLFFKYV